VRSIRLVPNLAWIDFGRTIQGNAMDEKRTAPRHRVLKAGTIEFGGGAIDCTIRNMSIGAALDVSSPIGIPDQFTLVLPADGQHIACHVVWRKQKRIGIAFD
jgi:hypothetical protein